MMAHFYYYHDKNQLGIYHLATENYALVDSTPPLRPSRPDQDTDAFGLLHPIRGEDGDISAVFLSSRARRLLVNGEPLVLGGRILQDKDQLSLPNRDRLRFSTERLAVVTRAPDISPVCVRCKQVIESGTAVRCPNCGNWHHQQASLECWTDTPFCASCRGPTDLSNPVYRDVPEDL